MSDEPADRDEPAADAIAADGTADEPQSTPDTAVTEPAVTDTEDTEPQPTEGDAESDDGPADPTGDSVEPVEPEPAAAQGAESDGAESEDAEADEPAAAGEVQPGQRRRRRLRVAGATIGVLCLLLGFALVAQVRTTSTGAGLQTTRQEDLVRILDDLSSREDRLRSEITGLQNTQDSLTSGKDKNKAALDEAHQEAADLAILAGTAPATGPGIVLTITDPQRAVGPEVVLDAIQELRAAGAEAMQISTVRIAVSTAFTGVPGAVVVDGAKLTAPYVVRAIGDPATLSAAMNIPGGVVATVRRSGGQATVQSRQTLLVDALRPADTPDYAQPAQPTD